MAFRVNLYSAVFLLNILYTAIMVEFIALPASGSKGRKKLNIKNKLHMEHAEW